MTMIFHNGSIPKEAYREQLRERLAAVIRGKLHWKEAGELSDATRLREDLCIDSIMIVQLIVYLETELHLLIPDEQVDPRAFATIGTLLDFMETLPPIESNTNLNEGEKTT
jgi:acyl carrier protein